MSDRPINLTRTYEYLILGLAKVIQENPNYLDMPKQKFVGQVMKHTHGTLHPRTIEEAYNRLLEEAGVREMKYANVAYTTSDGKAVTVEEAYNETLKLYYNWLCR